MDIVKAKYNRIFGRGWSKAGQPPVDAPQEIEYNTGADTRNGADNVKKDERCYVIDGDKLRGKRISLGFTQKELYERSGVGVDSIRKHEKAGPHNMYMANVVALANALQCTPQELFYVQCERAAVADETVPECQINESPERERPLAISPYADEALRMATAGLLRTTGSRERVSYAIASISGYMRSIVWRAPELKYHMSGLINVIVRSYESARLDDETSMHELRNDLRSSLLEIRNLEDLHDCANKEAGLIIDLLDGVTRSKDNDRLLRAVKLAMYWLRDYWHVICRAQAALYAWSDVCCLLGGAPDDHTTRECIMREVNEFALYVSLLDPLYEMMHNN